MDEADAARRAAQQQLDAYNARDVKAFLQAYAEDCVVKAFPSGRVLMAGKPVMRARYRELFEGHPDLACRLVSRAVHGPFVVDHEEVEGLEEGRAVEAVAIYEVREGLIQRVWFLRDEA